jgi:hypothetical protein
VTTGLDELLEAFEVTLHPTLNRTECGPGRAN